MGNPISSIAFLASLIEFAILFFGCLKLSLLINFKKRSLSSARSIVSGVVPRILIPRFSSSLHNFNGVCPPN